MPVSISRDKRRHLSKISGLCVYEQCTLQYADVSILNRCVCKISIGIFIRELVIRLADIYAKVSYNVSSLSDNNYSIHEYLGL